MKSSKQKQVLLGKRAKIHRRTEVRRGILKRSLTK